MKKFWATIEYVPGQRFAVICLTGEDGAWAGAHRVEINRFYLGSVRNALYEEGYRQAAMAAKFHGGRLERYSVLDETP